MATTLDWVKSLKADIRGNYLPKRVEFNRKRVGGKMIIQIDKNDENVIKYSPCEYWL